MANAVQAALDRASPEQRARAQQAIEGARNNIRLLSVQPTYKSLAGHDAASRQVEVIAEARTTIPF